VISVEEALARILGLGRVVSPVTVPLAEAAGRVMLEAATARRDQPPFPASAMDGYALCPGEAGVGTQYAVVGEAGAGHGFDGALGPGQAVRIFTGAPVPRGADRVVIQEDVTAIGGRITLTDACPPNANIRPQGADFKVGAQLAAPRRLSPADIALLAAMNIAKVRVARKPVVAVIATGDELVMPGEAPRPDQIIASNAFALKAMAEDTGAEVRLMPIARDTPDALRTIFGLAQGADLIVTIGGASVGDHDHVGAVAESLAMERAFYKIAMRPGKPLMAGRMGGSVMLGLPGNPVSSIVCGHIFMLPLLRRMLGLPGDRSPMRSAILTDALPANGPRAHYMRARLTPAEALPHITPFGAQDSSLLTVLAEADALLVRAPHEGPRAAGDTVPFISLDRTSR
jgi:molybdopterin molybdotransferase